MNTASNGNTRRGDGAAGRGWLLGLEPVFEGGWRHKGDRARSWDVEDQVMALAILGTVTVDLINAQSTPTQLRIAAWAVGRDVEIFVAPRTRVELTGKVGSQHLHGDIPSLADGEYDRTVTIEVRPWLGDINVHFAEAPPAPSRARSALRRRFGRSAVRPAAVAAVSTRR